MEKTLLTVMTQVMLTMLTALACGILFKKIGQPTVCGEMAAGLILGPSLVGKLFPQFLHRLLNPDAASIVVTFSQVGLVLFLFLLGMEFDFPQLRSHGREAVLIAVSAMVVPLSAGFLLARLIFPWVSPRVPFLSFALFVATALSITALPVLAAILVDFGLNRTRLGVTAITAAALMDVIGWILLASVSAIVHSDFRVALTFKMLAGVTIYVLVMLFAVRVLIKRWARFVVAKEGDRISNATLAIVLSAVFASSMITNYIGVFAIFGGFMVGSIVCDEPRFCQAVKLRLESFVSVFFVPVFFVYTGLRTDIGKLDVALAWKLAALVFVFATISKIAPAALAAYAGGFSWRESWAMGVLMNTRGLMELVVLNLGYDLGVIPQSLFSVFVLTAVAVTLMTSPLIQFLLKRRLQYGMMRWSDSESSESIPAVH